MWQCLKCRETVENGFDVCWNCGTSREGTEDPTFRRADDQPATASAGQSEREVASSGVEERRAGSRRQVGASSGKVKCTACGAQAAFLGQIAFMRKLDSAFWSFVAAWSNRDAANLDTFPIDVFRCSTCGRLELYDFDLSLPEA